MLNFITLPPKIFLTTFSSIPRTIETYNIYFNLIKALDVQAKALELFFTGVFAFGFAVVSQFFLYQLDIGRNQLLLIKIEDNETRTTFVFYMYN